MMLSFNQFLFEHEDPEEYHRYIQSLPRVRNSQILDSKSLLFIRFGKFDETTRSRVGLDQEFTKDVMWGKTSENGLSVYFTKKYGKYYEIESPAFGHARYQTGGSREYFQHMLWEVFIRPIANDEVYIVTGNLLPVEQLQENSEGEFIFVTYDTGSDGEPLLDPESVKIVKQLDTQTALDYLTFEGFQEDLGDMGIWYNKNIKFKNEVWNYTPDATPEEQETSDNKI